MENGCSDIGEEHRVDEWQGELGEDQLHYLWDYTEFWTLFEQTLKDSNAIWQKSQC